MKADKPFYFKHDGSQKADAAWMIIATEKNRNRHPIPGFYISSFGFMSTSPMDADDSFICVTPSEALRLLQPFDRNNFCVDIQKEKDSPLLEGFKKGFNRMFNLHSHFTAKRYGAKDGEQYANNDPFEPFAPLYTLAELRSHLPEIWEGEAQWKPKQNDKVQFYQCGETHKGEIIVIYKDNAWVEVDGWETPMTVDVDRLRPVKTLRDEISDILYGGSLGVEDSIDRIMALIEQRKGEI